MLWRVFFLFKYKLYACGLNQECVWNFLFISIQTVGLPVCYLINFSDYLPFFFGTWSQWCAFTFISRGSKAQRTWYIFIVLYKVQYKKHRLFPLQMQLAFTYDILSLLFIDLTNQPAIGITLVFGFEKTFVINFRVIWLRSILRIVLQNWAICHFLI